DPRHLFLHGPLNGHGGTCVTLPLLYVAVGRRLGYPLTLARAKEHFYCRWQGEEPFAIEATSPGFRAMDDDYYLTWPKPLTEDDIQLDFYLRDLTPREELAEQLFERAICFRENLKCRAALIAIYHAAAICPQNPQVLGEWQALTMMASITQR